MSKTIRVNINVSLEIHEFYKEQGEKMGVSMSAMMAFALMQQMINMKQAQLKIDK